MPEPPPVTRETTARSFLKDRTGLRVGENAVDLFVTHFTRASSDTNTPKRARAPASEAPRCTTKPEGIDVSPCSPRRRFAFRMTKPGITSVDDTARRA